MAEIVVVGSCNIDQIVYTSRLPGPGETILGTDYQTGFGGKGANQCIAAAKLGGAVVMVAKLGDDENGRSYRESFVKNGVDVSHVTVTKKSCTGVAPITVATDGNNSIVVFPGANMLLSTADVDAAELIITSSKLLLCQLEIDMLTTLHALKIAKKAGVTTLLNIAPAIDNLNDEIFQNSDIICLNETEASALSGIEVTDSASALPASKKLLARGSKVCIITLGAEGCVLVQADGSSEQISGNKVQAIDTTGAGDSFIGAFAFFYCRLGMSNMKEALSRANAVAAVSVTKRGTQSSYPARSSLPNHLFNGM